MNPAHVSLLVRTDVRRRYRSALGNTRRVAIFGIIGVFLLVPLGGAVLGLYRLGEMVAEGSLPVGIAAVRAGAGALVVVPLAIGAVRTIQTGAVPANADAALTMADHAEVVAALVIVEAVAAGGVVLIPGGIGAVAFGVGAGSLVAGCTFLAAVLGVVALGALSGIAVGFAVRNALARSPTLARYRTPAAVAFFLGYLYLVTAADLDSAFLPVARALGRTPAGWYADLALAPLPAGANLANAGGAVAVTGVGVLLLGAAIDRLAGLLWYVEPVEPTTGERDASGMGTVGGIPRPIARVAWKSWLRAWRSPIRLLYVVYPLFFVVGPASEVVRTGVFPPYLPGSIALYGAWATGAAFTLNPLGDEGDVLPVTLATPISGRSFVAGHCFAGLAIGLPATVVGALGTAALAGSSTTVTVAATALAVAFPVGATAIAAGVGVTLPRFESVNVTRGREAVVPSLAGFAVYSVALLVAFAPGGAVVVPETRGLLASATGSGPGAVTAAGVVASVLLVATLGLLSYSHAVRTFDSYVLG